ncbi:MAG: 50S ribosomal protein L11 methyltransferase [Pseudomonadota bacterium]
MTTYSALTTTLGAASAEALGESLERLEPAPTGVGVFEVEDGLGQWEVGGYFSERPDKIGLDLLAAAHGAKPFTVSRIEDRDWVAQVRRELHPVDAGRFTVFGGHDADRIAPNRTGLRIEAAMAFGTGHHATTRGCLLLLERALMKDWRPVRVADIGCGTGVLAMAAARACRSHCWASDIDPVAAATAAANVKANGTWPLVRTGCVTGFRHAALHQAAPFDLIFANILAGPLKRLAPAIAGHLARGGRAILSGVMQYQAAGVLAVFRSHGLHVTGRVDQDVWSSLEVTKNARLAIK